jgi:hypothetical protein
MKPLVCAVFGWCASHDKEAAATVVTKPFFLEAIIDRLFFILRGSGFNDFIPFGKQYVRLML